MSETIREKRLRYLLIFLILLIIAFAFIWRYQKMIGQSTDSIPSPSVAVLHESEDKKEHPFVAIYRYLDKKHVLTLYEIIPEQDYFFKTVAAAELRKAPEEIAADRKDKGVWLKFSGKWRYFNDVFEEVKRADNTRQTTQPVDFKIRENEGTTFLMIEGEEYRLGSREKVKAVYSLSTSEPLWLAVTESEFFILHQ